MRVRPFHSPRVAAGPAGALSQRSARVQGSTNPLALAYDKQSRILEETYMYFVLRLTIVRILIALGLLASLAGVASAQTGSIAGTVSDASGAVVQGAEVMVRNTATNESHKAISGAAGTYTVSYLPVGTYEITVRKEGFKIFRLPSVELTVAQSITVDPKLALGSASEEVTVRANNVQDVDLETSQITNLVDQRQMQSLPLITRNPY